MNNKRKSRSPTYKREHSFGMSSLSSGSVEDNRTAYSARKHHKSERGRRDTSRERVMERGSLRDKDERTRVTGAERDNEKNEYEKYRKNKQLRETRGESPEEESYLKLVPLSLHKEHETRTVNSERLEGIDELMLDPSTCNFRATSHDDVVLIEDKPEDRKVKEDSDNRLERLEKLVELLVNNNSKPQPILSHTSQENSWFPSNKDVHELVPRNTNFTVSMWLNKIHEECVQRNFDEKTSIQFLVSSMTGLIKAWYKTIPAYDFSWPELKMLITKTFPDNIDFAATLRLLVERKKVPEESVTQYYFSKMYLIEACKISGPNAVSCLIDGLENESFKYEAKCHNFLTPEALYSQFLLKYSFDQPQEVAPELVEYEEVYTTEIGQINQPNINYSKGKNAKKCLTCGKKGHLTLNCRHAPHCYICRKVGHIAINCPINRSRKILMISKKELHTSNDIFNYMLCYVNGRKLHAYIDSGCSVITIKESVAQDLNLKYKSSNQLIQGYGGGSVRALGEVDLFIKVDLVECILPAVVVPDTVQTAPLIIGQPLLFKRNVVMVLQNSGIRLFEKNLNEKHTFDLMLQNSGV